MPADATEIVTEATRFDLRARAIEAALLRALADVTQVKVAERMGCSESSVTRWKEGNIADMARWLAAMEVKVVPHDAASFDPKVVEAYRVLAAQHVNLDL